MIEPNNERSLGEAGAELIYNIDDYHQFDLWKEEIGLKEIQPSDQVEFIMPKFNLCYNYINLASWQIIDTYKYSTSKLFWIVFKPKNKKYDGSKCFMDHVRKKCGKYQAIIISREIYATKVHYNVFVKTEEDLEKMHDTQDSRFYVYSKRVPGTLKDIERVHEYLIKESRKRYFKSRVDLNKSPLDIFVQEKKGNIFKRYYNKT